MTARRAITRLLWIVLGAIVLVPLLVIGIEMAREPERDDTGRDEAGAPAASADEQVGRGAYLARAGSCMACHTARGGRQYAGGRAIVTPFGSIYSPNITPDDATGIGRWSADDFWRALHHGKSKDGRFLYPAFPYPNYTRMTRADADALYAYLRTLPPVGQANRDHALRFPYNQRVLLAFWRALYFTPGVYRNEPARTPEWNRGAYLVQGPGHCAACHTSRNALGGTAREGDLAGGMIPMLNWYASSLTSDAESGLGGWDAKDIASLLKTGVSPRGAVFGPMAEVVGASLQHLSQADIDAMADYLKSVPRAEAAAPPAAVRVTGDPEAILRRGARLYEDRCAGCHQADGKGVPPAYPPLAGNRSLTIASALNPIRIVLNGGFPPSTAGNPRPYGMPPFGPSLSDDDVAAVVSYIRTGWGNKGTLVSPVEVARFRGVPIE